MSAEDTTYDVLIGLLLLVVSFLVPAVPFYAIHWLLSKAIGFVTTHTGITTGELTLAFICTVVLFSSASSVRSRHWLNLFLSLALVTMIVATWLKVGHFLDSIVWIMPLWFLITPSDSYRLRPLHIASGALVSVLGFLLNIGLVPHTRDTDFIVGVAILAWIFFSCIRPHVKAQTESTAVSAQ